MYISLYITVGYVYLHSEIARAVYFHGRDVFCYHGVFFRILTSGFGGGQNRLFIDRLRALVLRAFIMGCSE